MDLRELVRVFWKYRALFAGTITVFVVAGFLMWALQSVRFVAEVTMNVARTGVRETSEYAYDDFYRLQADERFADTVVRWLESPRILADIEREAKVEPGSTSFDAGRLSSQVIRVRFLSPTPENAEALSRAMFTVLNRETASLNAGKDVAGWFSLVGERPALSDARFGKTEAFGISGFLGTMIGFFGVLFRWHFSGEHSFYSIGRGRRDGHEDRY